MFRSVVIATILLLGAGAPHALELGDCDDRDADRAIAGCSLLLERAPEKPSEVAHVLLHRAIVYNAKGDYDRAIADLKKALRLTGGVDMVDRFKGDAAEAHYHLGLAYEKKGERDRAIDNYRENIKSRSVHPQASDALRRLGVAGGEIDRWRVEGSLGRGNIARTGRGREIAQFRASRRCRMFAEHAEFAWAIAECDEAIKLSGAVLIGSSASAYVARGRVYLAMGDLDRALADMDEAIRLDPRGNGHVARGAVLTEKNELDRAIVDFDEAIKLDPGTATAFAGRARAYEKKGERDKAIADYRKALEVYRARFNEPYAPSIEALKRLGAEP